LAPYPIWTLPDCRSSHIPRDPAQGEVCGRWNWVHMWSVAHAYTTESNWYAQSNTLKPDRPQPDQPAASHRPAVFFRHLRLTDARKISAPFPEMLPYFVLF
jgi:hypothetical protein